MFLQNWTFLKRGKNEGKFWKELFCVTKILKWSPLIGVRVHFLSLYRYSGCFTVSYFWKRMVHTPCHWICRIGYLPLTQTSCYTRKVSFRIRLHFCLFLEEFNFVKTKIVIKLLNLFIWNFLQKFDILSSLIWDKNELKPFSNSHLDG